MTIHSVSILFYVSGRGFLICNEMRKKFRSEERELKCHPIGGKVEESEDPLKAACREFLEEYNRTNDHSRLYAAVRHAKYGYFDVLVSPAKGLENRFYVVNTSSISDDYIRNFIESAEEAFDRNRSDLVDVFFWNGKDKLNDASSLLQMFADKWKPSDFVIDLLTSNDRQICRDRFISVACEFIGDIGDVGDIKYTDDTILIIERTDKSGDILAFLAHDGDVMYCGGARSPVVKIGNVDIQTTLVLDYFMNKE